MCPSATSLSGRASARRRKLHRAAEEADHAPLRLSVTRGVLGIEIYEPIEIGPLVLEHLSMTLPGLAFPLDLSGGVRVFRHRRGDLVHAKLSADSRSVARWLTNRLKDVVGPLERPVTIWPTKGGVGVGLSGHGRALAFDLLWAPDGEDARWVVAGARGVGLAGGAIGYAIRALDSAFGKLGQRRGRVVTIARAGLRLGQSVLPALGARAPRAGLVRFGEIELASDTLSVELDSTFSPPALPAETTRALELALVARDADDCIAAGRLDEARAFYMGVLERAPRHPEIARTVAELDVGVPGRQEAALGLLVESVAATRSGAVGGELLASVGDADGARDAFASAASAEPFAPLSALLWRRLSQVETSATARLEALNEAVGRAPALAEARWARFDARLGRGDVEGALADAQHLEAAAEGSRARHEICRRVARRLLEEAYVRESGKMFERALRYLPDDPTATAGLARALLQAGRTERAVTLFERAIALGEKRGEVAPDALVDLARVLAGELRDLPQAIARVRQVRPSAPQVIEARGLEGRWRAGLGDVAGATIAFSRLRDEVESALKPDPRECAAWLLEAAEFERDVQKDALAAEQHLTVAVRLAPRDRRVADAYREIAAVVAARRRRERERRLDTDSPPAGDTGETVGSREDDEALADQLRSRILARPADRRAALQLADVLERLGRLSEWYAVLSAQMEDADAAGRDEIRPRLRRALDALIAKALAEGNRTEAERYQAALAGLS